MSGLPIMRKWTLQTRLAAGLCLLALFAVVPGAVVVLEVHRSTALVAGLGVAALVAVGLASLIFYDTTRSLRAVVLELDSNSAEIASASSQVSDANTSSAECAGKQTAAIEEASASLEEISSTTKLNAEHARQAKDLASEAHAAANRGVSDMQAIGDAIEALNSSSGEISKILKTIDGIAFQSNILALNASVEAARAGESGAGFAVVADEVRNLAHRTAAAAKETAGKIDDVVNWISQCEILKVEVVSTLNHIAAKARQVAELVAEVAAASSQQAEGIVQINSAVSEVSQATQRNAASTEECAAAAEELQAQSHLMRQSVAGLLALLGGLENNEARQVPAAAGSPAVATLKPARELELQHN